MKGPVRWGRMPSVSVVKIEGVPVAAKPWVVSDELWGRIEPLLPRVERRFRYPGRRRLPDREALQGILFVLHTGIAWRHLPLELGFGAGSTCYRRLDEWQRAGVWNRLHEVLLAELHADGLIEWDRAVADGSHVQAKKGAPKRARARLIEPETAPSTTSWSTRPGSRSPGRSPAATATTSPSCSTCSTGYRPSAAASAGHDGGRGR